VSRILPLPTYERKIIEYPNYYYVGPDLKTVRNRYIDRYEPLYDDGYYYPTLKRCYSEPKEYVYAPNDPRLNLSYVKEVVNPEVKINLSGYNNKLLDKLNDIEIQNIKIANKMELDREK
jgi:hypothetical protein